MSCLQQLKLMKKQEKRIFWGREYVIFFLDRRTEERAREEIVFGERPTHEQTSFQEKTRPEFLGVVKDFKH